ncbi:MAG: hypothetical protein J2P15_09315 [Micromonosporaceae bacterium]|nr:hypothetical protein [Micromonosporaceae bacterium]
MAAAQRTRPGSGSLPRGARVRLFRLAPYLVAMLIAVASVFGLVSRPATGAPRQRVDYVVIAGAAGLRWDDVNPTDTPTLWRLAQQGSIGALSVHSAREPTCPADGWLTLGAGNLADASDLAGPATATPGACPVMAPEITSPDGIGGNLPDQERKVVPRNRGLPSGTEPGALAEAVRCTVAIGTGAAIAAARPFGRVDRYLPSIPTDAQQAGTALSSCVLSIVDLGTISGDYPVQRAERARQADAALAKVLAVRPANSLVLVAGLSDTDRSTRLHVAIADGPGYGPGWLTSSSTSRPGYLQLVDLAPTALNVLGKQLPTKLFTGQPVDSGGGRPGALTAAVAALSDADREAGAQRQVADRFYAALAVLQLVLFAAVVPMLRRARRHGGRSGPPSRQRKRPPRQATAPPGSGGSRVLGRVVRAVEVALVAGALVMPAALIADAVPWWRSGAPGLLFGGTTGLLTIALTAMVVAGPWGKGALGPVGAVAGIGAAIVGVDVLTGSRLQLNGVAGYSALEGGRYAGVGTVGLGLFIAGVLLVTGWLAQRLGRRWRPTVVAVLGGVGVVLVGSPYLGADVGGAVALTAGVCLAAAISTGGWLTFARLAWATLAGLTVTTGFALLDLRRPVEDRGGLGRFLTAARDGSGGTVVHSTAEANAVALLSSPLTLVALGAAVLLAFALLRPWGGLKRLFGLYPPMRAGLVGVAVAAVLAGGLDGAGLNVAGAAATMALPLAALAALRVLGHADDRTVGEAVAVEPEPEAHGAPMPEPAPAPVTAVAAANQAANQAADRPAGPDEVDLALDTDLPAESQPAIQAPGASTQTVELPGTDQPAVGAPPAGAVGDVLL